MEAQYTTRETLLKKDIKKEVTEYCKKNPDKLSEQELSIV
jgi:phage host-nuclease inhibitor protein Gam